MFRYILVTAQESKTEILVHRFRLKGDGMDKRLPILYLTVLLVVLSNLTYAQQSKQPDGVRLISVGEITKINRQKKTFELKSERGQDSGGERVVPDGTAGNAPGGIHGSIWVGVSTGRRQGGIDGGRPGRGPDQTIPPLPSEDRTIPPLPPEDRTDSTVRTNVLTTIETVFKEAERPITFEDLKVGDNLEVTGVPRGKNVEAKEIIRKKTRR
jgi:hypothetical protein